MSSDTDFIPSQHGFHFPNSFADGPVVNIEVPFLGKIGVGNARGGMCGGMVFAAMDYWAGVKDIPLLTEPPEQGSPLYEYIARRLIDSFHLPAGVWQYFAWMMAGGDLAQRQYQELCRIQAGKKPMPLGLVRQHSLNPADLAHCHQVLALECLQYSTHIYDPNYPDRDDIVLEHLGGEYGTAHVSHSVDGPIRGFFRSNYKWERPPEKI